MKPRTFVVCALALLCFLGGMDRSHAGEISREEILSIIERAMKNYEAINALGFKAKFHAPELSKVISDRLAAQYGIQVKPSFQYVHDAGSRAVIKAQMDSLSEPYRSIAETKMNEQAAFFIGFVNSVDAQRISNFLKVCRDSAQFDLIQSDKEVLDIEIELREPLAGKSIQSLRFKINRAKATVDEVNFHFGPKQSLHAKISYLSHELPGKKETVYLFTTVEVRQTAFTTGEYKMPPEFSTRLADFEISEKYDPAPVASPKDRQLAYIRGKARLEKIGAGDKLHVDEDGNCHLNLTHTATEDLSPYAGLDLLSLDLTDTKVTNLGPLKGTKLQRLILTQTPVSDLSPLAGMPIEILNIVATRVSDLGPLKGMPLKRLDLNASQVSDLGPLQGMPLTWLDLTATPITDLNPLKGMPLAYLALVNTKATDLKPIRELPLKTLSLRATPITDLSSLKGMKLESLDLGACYELHDIGPIQGMPLKHLAFESSKVADLSALKGMPLESLDLRQTPVSDLSPLQGLPLKQLRIAGAKVSDLSPLRGMPLEYLEATGTQVSDLSPLTALPLTELMVGGTAVSDLRPLNGLRLKLLRLTVTKVGDLSPLKGMPLESLDLYQTSVTDLSPLQGMPLKQLVLLGTPISDLKPLAGMPLEQLVLEECTNLQDLSPLASCTNLQFLTIPSQCKDIAFLRRVPLKRLSYGGWPNGGFEKVQPAADFWKEHGGAMADIGKPEPDGAAVLKPSQPAVTVSDTVDLASLARNRAEWPAEVSLKTKVSVPVVVGGKQYGTTELPAGTTFKLLRVQGEQLAVLKGQTTNAVAASATDLVDRVVAGRRAKAAEAARN